MSRDRKPGENAKGSALPGSNGPGTFSPSVVGDSPIESPAQDLLHRAGLAKDIAAEIRSTDASDGVVIAAIGPWGSGKTSLINMIRTHLELSPEIPVVDFNPWMFSGSEQLVDIFFREMSAQLKVKTGRVAALAAEIEAYGNLLAPLTLIPVVGTWVDRVTRVSGAVKRSRDLHAESVVARRKRLSKALGELEQPIVVVVDDIDRLQTQEIRDIFKLVRLNASFPNVIYLLAFDRARVEEALTEVGLLGRNYLEKIVQVVVDVPVVMPESLLRQLGAAIDEALSGLECSNRFDESRWPDVLAEIVLPLIHNMRDVRRYVASIRITARGLGSNVELVDVLALEAIRIFQPDLFEQVIRVRRELTQPSGAYSRYRQSNTNPLEDLVEAASSTEVEAKDIAKRLFPAALQYFENTGYGEEWLKTWLRARRVAHPEILGLYLNRVTGEGLTAFVKAERAYQLLASPAELEKFLDSIEPDKLEDTIAALENFDGEYPPDSAGPASTVLLNFLPKIPARRRGFLNVADARLIVCRVVLRMLRQIDDPAVVETVVREIYSSLVELTPKVDLVVLVGHVENAGHKLVSEGVADELQALLVEDVRRADAGLLAKETGLLRLLLIADSWGGVAEHVQALNSAELNARILVDALTDVRSQPMDSRAITVRPQLQWDNLKALLGDEDKIREAMIPLGALAVSDPKLQEAVSLAERYLDGWRPASFPS